jgi:PAS domain S-box-containing protein
VTKPNHKSLEKVEADWPVRLSRKVSSRWNRKWARFAGRFKPRVVLAALYLSASVLSCAHEIVPIDTLALKHLAAAQTSDGTSLAAGDHEFTLNLNGSIVHFRIRMSMLGLGVIFTLAGLLAAAAFLAAMARRRASEAEAANRQLKKEISERRRAEEEVLILNADLERRQADEKFRGLLESAPDAMVIVNRDSEIVLVNSQTEDLFGYERHELVGRGAEILLSERFRNGSPEHGGGYFTESCEEMDAGLDLYGLNKHGNEFPIEIRLSPFHTEQGVLVSTSIRDITDRKRFEETLQGKNVELEKANRAKDQFLAGMSHELRTPLNAIIGFTGTLLMRLPGPLTPDQEKQLRTVQASGRHLLSLINDLLDLAKIESGKVALRREIVNCAEVLNEIASYLQRMADGKDVALSIDVTPNDLLVETDRRALHQILLNLANNAVKFTDAGFVHLQMREKVVGSGTVVEFAASDTGVGIRPEDQDKLFQAFSQVDASNDRCYQGTGLGLHLSQKLAELLAGQITFESDFGKGSTFRLTLRQGNVA